jgi:hypothetical protein
MRDPNNTDRCPLGFRCESCGLTGPGLEVRTVDVLGATFCLTLCPGCRDNGRPPSIMLSTAQKLVEQHRQHLAGPPSPRTKLVGDPSR